MTMALPRQSDAVEALDWESFKERMRREWKQGEHFAVVAPTGAGKTTFSVGLLSGRKYVLAFDPKGGDDTLAGSGFERITHWDKRLIGRKLKDNEDEGRPTRLIIGKVVQSHKDRASHRSLMQQALSDSWEMGGWTCYVDELQLFTDPKMYLDFGDIVQEYLIAARTKRLSVMTTYQRPANVPRAASDQATWFAISRTRDMDVVQRLAEMAGRPYAEMRGAVKACPEFCWLVFGRNPFAPIMITKPDQVKKQPQKH